MAARIQTFPNVTVEGALVAERVSKVGRKQRRPSHPFYLKYKPYELQPFCIAPVLPGETMKNALIQARCVSDPVKNPLIGWWNEYYLFYVKLTDLVEQFPELSNMLLKNEAPDLGAPYVMPQHYLSGQDEELNFVAMCIRAIAHHYFRDEEEWPNVSNDSFMDGGNGGYKAKVTMNNAFQSATNDIDVPKTESEELPGEGYDALPAHLSGFSAEFEQWKEMVAMKMTEVIGSSSSVFAFPARNARSCIFLN